MSWVCIIVSCDKRKMELQENKFRTVPSKNIFKKMKKKINIQNYGQIT